MDADASQLALVFSALLKNAVEAISGEGRVTVNTRYLSENNGFGESGGDLKGPRVCLTVEDNGQGMCPEITERMFQPFFSTKFQGRGLDMAAVQGIVSNHNGEILVDSILGQGTRVRVFLPVTMYRPSTVFDMPETVRQASGTVLVVDDDVALGNLAVIMLTRLGYRAMVATSGSEAIKTVQSLKNGIDLVLLDVEMPDMNGNEIYPHLIKASPDLTVVVCSGYSLEGPVQDLLKMGAALFLQKPYSFSELSRILQSLIERRKHPRYKVREGRVVFELEKNRIEKDLIDISLGGAAVKQPDMPAMAGFFPELSLVADRGAFLVAGIPFQVINTPFSSDRLNLCFGGLEPRQIRQMDYFISHFTL